jgi:hypothetical protein
MRVCGSLLSHTESLSHGIRLGDFQGDYRVVRGESPEIASVK